MRKKSHPFSKPRARRRIPLVLSALSIAALGSLSPRVAAGQDSPWTSSWRAGTRALSIVMDPRDPGTLFASTQTGIFKTVDGGLSWTDQPVGPKDAAVLAIDPTSSLSVFAGTPNGLEHSTDGGVHFSSLPLRIGVTAIQIDPLRPATMYAVAGNVMKSNNAGVDWVPSAIDLTTLRVASLLLDGLHPATLYAGADEDASYYPLPGAAFKSTDAAGTWRPILAGRAIGVSLGAVTAFAIDPLHNGTVYAAATTRGGGRVLRSLDDGGVWTPFGLPLAALPTSLAIDPTQPSTLYAGTDRGVFRSDDGGVNWTLYSSGLGSIAVSALLMDPAGTVLHAATVNGVFEVRTQKTAPVYPCVPNSSTLCLLEDRFQATLIAQDPRTGRRTTGTAVSRGDRFGYFSLPGFTSDPDLPEVLVKMVDARAVPGNGFWVFFGGLTDVRYALTIADTFTGELRLYENSPGAPFCGGADTAAFQDGSGPGAAVVRPPAAALSGSGATLSLLDARFHLTLSATDPRTGRTAAGTAIAGDDRSGYFSLPAFTGDADFPEVFVKMVDATSVFGDFWLFHTGLTDLAYTLTVDDSVTGATRTYEKPGGDYCGAADPRVTRP